MQHDLEVSTEDLQYLRRLMGKHPVRADLGERIDAELSDAKTFKTKCPDGRHHACKEDDCDYVCRLCDWRCQEQGRVSTWEERGASCP